MRPSLASLPSQTRGLPTIKLKNIIGREPTEGEIKNYIKLNNESLKTEFGVDWVKNPRAAADYYVKNNLYKIHQISTDSEKYSNDYFYKKELEAQPYLVEIRAYRKLNRTIEKAVLLQGDEGVRNVPPGQNTTLKITAGGTASLLLGELGSYGKIGEANLATLKNFANFFLRNTIVGEKESEFQSLTQIEAIRNPSSLLTSIMFFELSKAKFQPSRIALSYDFQNIKKQMPMAMKGAVSGSIYLEQEHKGSLPGKLPYDFRET